MKIIRKSESIYTSKDDGINVHYYLFPEYEIHIDEQVPHSVQNWHHHLKIWETIIILQGELVAEWVEKGKTYTQIVKAGDIIEVENSSHTFKNETDDTVKYIALKQVLSGQDKKELFKNDKIVD